MMAGPENGSSANPSCAKAARECAPLRKSIGRVASKTRAPSGTLIMMGVEALSDRLVSWGWDGALRFWSLEGGKLDGGAERAHNAVMGILTLLDGRLVTWG